MITDPPENSFKNVLIIWSIIGPIIGGIIGFFIKRWHVKYQISQQQFSSACNDFIEYFIPTIARIENIGNISSPYGTIMTILSEHNLSHKQAVAKFRGFLSPEKTVAFNEAWINFSCEDYEERNLPKYYNYADPVSTKEVKKTVLENIYNLLKFANYKS